MSVKWGDGHQGGMTGRFESNPVQSFEEQTVAATESITQWAFEQNLEVYQIVYGGNGNWLFSAVEAGKAGGWSGDLMLRKNGEIIDIKTWKVYREAENAKAKD